jgi:nitrate/nitrite transport system substrate-binding protein
VLTGRFADGLGRIRNEPGRAGFDAFPWQSNELGIEAPKENYARHTIMGKIFDSARPEAYVASFSIRRS